MEFKFRAVDNRPPPPPPPHPPVVHQLPSPVPAVPPFANGPLGLRSPMPNAYDAWAPERERERIREEEILLDMIARRREVELEARRDIDFLERELAARRARLSFDRGYAPIQWGSYSRLLEPRHSFSDEWCGLPPRPAVPLPPWDGCAACEVGTPSLDHNKDKVIILAKPNPNVSRTERKSVEPPPTLAPPFGLMKKPKDEWSCALCQVSVSNEIVWNEHLQGKKHKANEERLKKQKLASSHKSEPSQTKSRRNGSNSKSQAELEGESLDENNTGNVSTDFKPELVSVKAEIAGDLNNAPGSEMAQQANGTEEQKEKNKFTFWCEMCRIGSFSAQVMEDHKNGKKHRANLLKLDKSNEATKPNHIAAEAIVPKLVMGSETSCISLENNVPMPKIPNLICECDVYMS